MIQQLQICQSEDWQSYIQISNDGTNAGVVDLTGSTVFMRIVNPARPNGPALEQHSCTILDPVVTLNNIDFNLQLDVKTTIPKGLYKTQLHIIDSQAKERIDEFLDTVIIPTATAVV